LAEALVRDARIDKNDYVLEIGPGLGALTRHIVNRPSKGFFVIELEQEFCDRLAQEHPSIADSLICADVCVTSIDEILPADATKALVLSNVPYSISTEVILWTIANRAKIKRASYLLQREFAERVAAPPGTRACGSLSVLCALYARLSLGRIVPGSAFVPRAKVESRLLEIELRDRTAFEVDEVYFEQVVRAGFAQRRKTLVNSLSSSGICQKALLEDLLRESGIDVRVRAENLTLEQFANLSTRLTQSNPVPASPIKSAENSVA
jgi:16S rRNA (adenine1518-N6/adenine1519-N6)-dimethyltransferase